MTRHHVIAGAVFIVSGSVFHQPGASSIETGIVAAACAGVYLLVVASYLKERTNERS